MEPADRKVIQRSPPHTVRLLHFPNLQTEPVEADSALERDFVQTAALFPFTQHIQHQPFKLKWEDASYTPDFLLRFRDGTQLVVEVKPQTKLDKYRPLFDRAAAKLNEHGLPFSVALDTQIHKSERAANALEVRRYGKTRFPGAQCEQAVLVVNRHADGIRFRDAITQHDLPREVLLHLVSRQLVALDSNLSIDSKARVFPIHDSKEKSHAIQFASWFDAQVW